ncbi:MAG: peptidoglycan-binding protein [Clostridia bacterium]|nr:peptidoglycan-binding protein [Clostridia bacterium]
MEAAVLAFQKDFGLEETGRLDEETYLFLTEDQEDAPAKDPAAAKPDATAPPDKDLFVIRGEAYTDKGHVAAYLRAFGELPPNYITKEEAQALGWVSIRHNLWDVAPGKSIGGDRFGNYEGQLPTVKGRKYYECDIDFNGKYRNDKRIVYSNDGRIFYTDDHYDTFEEME